MKFNWNIVTMDSMCGTPLPKSLHTTTYTKNIKKVTLSFSKENLRLRASISGQMTFLGGKNGQGYFDSVEAITAYVNAHYEELEKVKTMNKLIYI